MFLINELYYGLDLSKKENKEKLDMLSEVEFSSDYGDFDFPYHGGQTCYDVRSVQMGIPITDDYSGKVNIAKETIKAKEREQKYREDYEKFKVDLLKYLEEYNKETQNLEIDEYLTEEEKKEYIKVNEWLINKVKTEEPDFYICETSS